MSRKDIKLIALDIDGTLLNSKGEISSYTEKVIQNALEREIHIVLSTGRPLPLCSQIANQLKATNYIITNNGAEIWENEKNVIARHIMNPNTIEALWNFGHKRNLSMWMVSPQKLFRRSSRPDEFKNFEWLKFGYGNLDQSTAQLLHEKLLQYEDLEVTSSSATNIEINQKGVNKLSALKRVCNELTISLENVMAIGDNLNDLQMIKNVGYGIAVHNATPVLKEYARFITASNDLNGVAKAIEKFAL